MPIGVSPTTRREADSSGWTGASGNTTERWVRGLASTGAGPGQIDPPRAHRVPLAGRYRVDRCCVRVMPPGGWPRCSRFEAARGATRLQNPEWSEHVEQAHLPAEQPSAPQDPRLPPAHAHACRAVRCCPHAAARAAPVSQPERPTSRLPGVLPVSQRLTSPSSFREVVRRGHRCGGPLLVVHLHAPAALADPTGPARPDDPTTGGPLPARAGLVVSKAVGTGGDPQPGQAPPAAPGPRAPRRAARRARCSCCAPCRRRRTPPTPSSTPSSLGAWPAARSASRMKYRPDRAAARVPLRDQPAVRAGVPLPPHLLGLRPRGHHRAWQCEGVAGSPYAASGGAIRGLWAVMTQSLPIRR